MISVLGIYDGESVKLSEKIFEKKRFKVVVTFLEELSQEEGVDLRDFSSQPDGLAFWMDPREDLYQDYLKSEKQ